MSVADAVYGLRQLLMGDDADVDRVSSGVETLYSMINGGLGDKDVEDAAMLLSGYVFVMCSRYSSDGRSRVGELVVALQAYVDPVKGAVSGAANP